MFTVKIEFLISFIQAKFFFYSPGAFKKIQETMKLSERRLYALQHTIVFKDSSCS